MALVHILDKITDEIIGTLNSNKAEYWEAPRHDSLNAENTFDFTANATIEKSALLEKRNRLLIQDEDGFFREYIINNTEQNSRNGKNVISDASFVDIRKAKIIDPQDLTGTTAPLAVEFALSGTEWEPGEIEYTGTQTITIDKYTNPLDLLKTIASTFGLEFSFRIDANGNRVVGRYVDMKSQVAGFEGKEIRFGKDLIGVKRKEDGSQIITSLYGVYEKSDGTRLTVWVEDEDAFQRWGRNGQHLVDWYEPESTDEDMTIEKLTTLTQAELKKRIDAVVTYECDAVSIEHIFGREHEKIRAGQTVRIKDDGYNPPLYVEARIQEVDVDQITGKIQSFKIFNFIEYSKEDLERQIATLKQQMIQKAARVVIGDDGEPIINLDDGGFSKINVGEVISPSVPSVNAGTLNFYVDWLNGDDNNDGTTVWVNPKKTLSGVIAAIPQINNGVINIYLHYDNCKDLVDKVLLSGITGNGTINIVGQNTKNTCNGWIKVVGCTNSVIITDLTIAGQEGACLEVERSTYVQAVRVWALGDNSGAGSSGFKSFNGGYIHVKDSFAYYVTFGCYASHSGSILVQNTLGKGTSRGVVAQYGGTIKLYGDAYPNGGTSATYSDSGGQIIGTGTTDANGTTTNPVTVVTTTNKWVSNVADNWSTSYSSWQGGGSKQGDWGYGQRKGFWWFESSPIALSGKTIKSMRVWVQRASSGGNSGKVRIYLHPHTYGTKAATPSNPSLALESTYNVYVDLAWGQGAWVNIPSSWFAGFQSGSYKGVGIWAGSTSKSYYSIMSGQATLEATYQ